MKKRTALVLGASGLVGQELVQQLLDSPHYTSVTILVRREMEWEDEKLQQKIVDFHILEQYEALFAADDVYSCLGTTIKKAKTKENFMKVDYEYTMRAAKLAEQHKVRNFLVISSMGADSKSLFFYSQVKGKVEAELKQLSIQGIHIFRPSLLLGDREEFRFGEKMAEKISGVLPFLYKGVLEKYKPIEVKQVAKAMYETALLDKTGIHIYESREMANM
ncbi:oxidoreductase [Ectobacillus panaciterrae]|uniref:oxidoreductase n=1 Tax=Ectobacillus panaciterrae TaxID=363872 RepID=UPI0003FED7A4|nr:oxidoreductase [Ectobacillus panaciterrae]